jgi:hypothetical protein
VGCQSYGYLRLAGGVIPSASPPLNRNEQIVAARLAGARPADIAVQLGVTRGAVANVLYRAGVKQPQPRWTVAERAEVATYYEQTARADFDLSVIAARVGHPRASVCALARQFGLTRIRGEKTGGFMRAAKAAAAGKWAHRPHPRGMAGKKHSEETKELVAVASKKAWVRHKATGTGLMSPENRQGLSDRSTKMWETRQPETAYSRCKHGRRPDLGEMYFRSTWEANYARYLNFLQARGEIERWEYEPVTFWFEAIKRGVRSYKPDFQIFENGRSYFVEVKGWMDDKSKTKLKRMAKYHPEVEVRVFGEKDYASLKRQLGSIIPGWEQ